MVVSVRLATLAIGFVSARRRSDLEVAAETVPTAVSSNS
jgi:hypothetical protein